MDAHTGAVIAALQNIQLPPIMHQEQSVDNRHRGDRPSPLEPYATRKPYMSSTTGGPSYQLQQEYILTQSTANVLLSQQPTQQLLDTSASAAQKRNQEFNDNLRKSLTRSTQRSSSSGSSSSSSSNGANAGGSKPRVLWPKPRTSEETHTAVGRGGMLTPSSQGSSNGNSSPPTQNGGSSTSTTGRSYPPILPWPNNIEQPISTLMALTKIQSSPAQSNGALARGTKIRRKWTEQETKDLLTGCSIHGVGNWKRVLDDSRFNFDNRSSVDLKDRFRTCFPKEYKKHFGKDKSENPTGDGKAPDPGTILVGVPEADNKLDPVTGKVEVRGRRRNFKSPVDVAQRFGLPKCFPKAQRRERKLFSTEEDGALLKGFEVYGPLWSKIQGDEDLQLSHRRSTDLRDRFRNAFPEKYAQAGFKAKPKHPPKPPRSSPAVPNDSLQINPLDQSIQRSPSLSSVDSHHQFDNPPDVSGLDDFGLGPPVQLQDHDHHSDDHTRKDSDFNVSMMQDFLGTNSSMRDWDPDPDSNPHADHHHHHHHHTANTLFSTAHSGEHDGHNSSSAPAGASSMSAMCVEAALGEDFGARIFDQGDLFAESPRTNAKAATEHHEFGKAGEDGDVGVGVTHDLVRWEDMVTHPIFTLDTGPSAPGVGGVNVGMDGNVSLAPISSAMLGGSGAQGGASTAGDGVEAVMPGLSALLDEISATEAANFAGNVVGAGMETGVMGVAPAQGLAAGSVSKKRQATARRKRKENGGVTGGETGGGEPKMGGASGVAAEKRRRTTKKKLAVT